MKLSRKRVEFLCRQQGTSIGQMLREAGVSPNAFYTLGRKDSVVPQSLIRISERLGVSVSALLDDVLTPTQRMKRLTAESDRISKRHRGVDRDNIRHTLLLLEEKPIERLRRALRRGQPINLR
jgi:lambda repressor-like predicted transcriptional regulator